MQKSYLEVIEQFILDTNTKHSGLSEVERFSKVIKLEGLEYDSFLFNAFKRVEKELDEIDVVTAIEAGMGYRYFNYLRVVAKVLDCPNYMTIHAVGNFITASAGLVSADNPVMPYMVDRAQYVSEDGWLIKALAARSGFWVDPIVLQTKRVLPGTHHGKFVDAQTGAAVSYNGVYNDLANVFTVLWCSNLDKLNTGAIETIKHMTRAIEYYGLMKDNGELLHVGFKDNMFLHIMYP